MLRPGALIVICPLSRGSYPSLFILADGGAAAIPLSPPHLSQGLDPAKSAESSDYRFRAEFRHTPSMSHCYRRMLFSEVARDSSASSSHMAATCNLP